jgi:Spy/CpxP family protein refolding chaperone
VSRSLIGWSLAGLLLLAGSVSAQMDDRPQGPPAGRVPRYEGVAPGEIPPGPPQARLPWWEDDGFCHELGLASDARKQIAALRHGNRKEEIKLRADLDLKEIDLRELLRSDSPDEWKVKAAAKEIAELRGRIFQNEVALRLQIGKHLTPEQAAKIRERGRDDPRRGARLPRRGRL